MSEVVFYIDGNSVRSGVLVNTVEPSKEDKKNGALTLYELGSGFSTPQVFKTQAAAQKALNDES
jgi:hypothetical protein